ncbi:MAG: gamma-glutamylputrescine oxidase [Pseudonocardiales bacterium]|jgi:glycine/D-amino acid oxidase-like deaminating enzyme|nr:gamma-glutamylputrescine oxidase [Pseudonocardiales bacterium]
MTVGWDDAASVVGWPGLPQLPGDRRADACVVGLGASGLAAVEALVERGLSVIGVDAGRVAAGAAGRNGGFLVAGPAPSLHEAIELWGECAVDLYRETLAELDRIVATMRPGIVRRVGSIRLAGLPGDPADDAEQADRDAEIKDCAAHAAALRRYGIAVEDYDGPLGRGLFLPDDAAVNPAQRVIEIAGRLEHRALLHERTRVQRVRAGLVLTDCGAVEAGVVIVAIDGKLGRVVPKVARRLRTARLQMLATAPVPPGRLPCPIYGRWGYDYAQQGVDGRLYVGGGRDRFVKAEWTGSTDPSRQVQRYIEGVAARMAGRPVEVTHRWGASVGFTADARPLCSLVDEGVVAVGGYNGTGNLVGPVAARAAVALALDGTPPPPYLAA